MKLPPRHEKGWAALAAAIVLATYLLALYVMPKHVFLSPDEGAKLIQLHTVQWHGASIRYKLPYHGAWLDPGYEFFPRTVRGIHIFPARMDDGSISLHWPLWFSLLTKPASVVFGTAGIYLLPLLSGWLIALIAGRLASLRNPKLAPAAILLVGFGTPVFFYSVSFWEHNPATLLALLATVVLAAGRPLSLSTPARMAPLLMAGALLRIEILAFAVAALTAWAVAGFAARDWPVAKKGRPQPPSGSAASRGFPPRVQNILALTLVLLLCLAFTGALVPRQQRFFQWILPLLATIPTKIAHLPHSLVELFINTPRSEGPPVPFSWSAVTLAGVGLCFAAAFITKARVEAACILTGLAVLLTFSVKLLLSSYSYRSLHGFFPLAPCTAVFLYALPQAWHRRDHVYFTLACLAACYLLLGVAAIVFYYVGENGRLIVALEWGPRYILTLYPIAAVLAVATLHDYWKSKRPDWLIAAFTTLMVASIVVGVLFEARGLQMSRFQRGALAASDRALRSTSGPLATGVEWLPAALTDLFLSKDLFLLSKSDLPRFAELAARNGVRHFSFAGQRPLKARDITWAVRNSVAVSRHPVAVFDITSFDLPPDFAPGTSVPRRQAAGLTGVIGPGHRDGEKRGRRRRWQGGR